MSFAVDALKIGPLAIEWGRLGLIAGSLLFLVLAGRLGRKAEGAALLVLLAGLAGGRLAYALADPANFAGAPRGWLSLLDPRYGSLSLPWGLAAGALAALLLRRGQALRLAGPGVAALAVGLILPLLRPAEGQAAVAADTPVYTMAGATIGWQDVPRPGLVNFWATWCPPCREEMPLLAEYAARGAPIVFMDDGEDPGTIKAYLEDAGLDIEVHIASSLLSEALAVTAIPTTIAIDSTGKVIARHLGPLDRRGLEDLISFIERK